MESTISFDYLPSQVVEDAGSPSPTEKTNDKMNIAKFAVHSLNQINFDFCLPTNRIVFLTGTVNGKGNQCIGIGTEDRL